MSAEQSWAGLARTALATASIGTLRLHSGERRLAVVSVESLPDGDPVVRLEGASPLVAALAESPVATLSTRAPAPGTRLELLGTFRPDAGGDPRDGCRTYRCSLLGVRLLGAHRVAIRIDDYRAATVTAEEPDRTRATLDHLGHAHGEAILERLREHGLPGEVVVPRSVRGRSVEVAVLWPDGVTTVRFVAGPGCAGSCRHEP